MSVIYYRRNQNTGLTCEQLDSTFDALRDRANHLGTQLASTISDLKRVIKGFSIILQLQKCCEDLKRKIQELQFTIFQGTELATIVNSILNEFRNRINKMKADVSALISKINFLEVSLESVNNSISSITASITNIQNTKAPINSPTFTGVAYTSTPVITSNSNQIATTAFVQTLFSQLGCYPCYTQLINP